jgi:hypothetical protein
MPAVFFQITRWCIVATGTDPSLKISASGSM